MKINVAPLPRLTISALLQMREILDFNPPYQREGGIWDTETQKRLIDSIVNNFDVPKLYFQRLTSRTLTPEGLRYQYSVIDGKQRLEAILGFMDEALTLPNDFIYFEDESVQAMGLSLSQLSERYPKLAGRIFDFSLPVIGVATDDTVLVEEMFQRLNASSSLNAAERRNAISGATRESANRLAQHPLLVERCPIRSARYKYRELGAKFLAIEEQISTHGRVMDTKAATLRRLFVETHDNPEGATAAAMSGYEAAADATLNDLYEKFLNDDPLLRSIGTMIVYYLVARAGGSRIIEREALQAFETYRRIAIGMSEDEPAYAQGANARLREYSVLVQSTNDGKALERRAQILSAFLSGDSPEAGMQQLDALGDATDVPEDNEDLPA